MYEFSHLPLYFHNIVFCGLQLLLHGAHGALLDQNTCKARDYGFGSVVCVCDSGHCDFLQPIGNIGEQSAVAYLSSKAGQRFRRSELKWTQNNKPNMNTGEEETLTVNFSKTYQKIDGFGGAFTDATGINVASLPGALQDHFFKSYFDHKGGIRYNLGRIPIASCDFSVGNYSYDDVDGDFDLQGFSLAPEDLQFKIPFIKRAFKLSQATLQFFGSPWSCPYWMKTNRMMQGGGTLIGEPGGKYYKTWAKYLAKFVQEYEKQGVKIWSLTVENEPSAGFLPNYSFQALGFTPESERDFVKFDLGPALAAVGRSDLKLMILDDRRNMLEHWADTILSDSEAAKYISHLALHWYWNKLTPIDVLNWVHERHPEVSLIGTEACAGWFGSERVILGSWERAVDYARDIIQNLNHWYTGWVDWNMALNLQGGPNWVENFVDSPIIVNASAQEFFKQPTFYAMGHFSAFLPRNSVRVDLHSTARFKNMDYVAFRAADNYKVVIVLNNNDFDVKIIIKEASDDRNQQLPYTAKDRSLSTIVWK